MISTRLAILGIAVVVLVIALAAGAAGQALHDLRRTNRRARPRVRRVAPVRYVPERTHLRPYSPEILAIVLLALAAGLWLSRLLR